MVWTLASWVIVPSLRVTRLVLVVPFGADRSLTMRAVARNFSRSSRLRDAASTAADALEANAGAWAAGAGGFNSTHPRRSATHSIGR